MTHSPPKRLRASVSDIDRDRIHDVDYVEGTMTSLMTTVERTLNMIEILAVEQVLADNPLHLSLDIPIHSLSNRLVRLQKLQECLSQREKALPALPQPFDESFDPDYPFDTQVISDSEGELLSDSGN